MREAFGTSFRTWIESSSVKDAVLGVVAGGREVSKGEEEDHLLSRPTSDFSALIRTSLKKLGVVKSIGDARRKSEIARSIDDGISVFELIKKIEGDRRTP